MKTVNIRGKIYLIDLEKKRVINVEDKSDIVEIRDDELDHFRSIKHAKRN